VSTDGAGAWFPLDNAAKIFPPALSGHFTTVFRLAAELAEPIRVSALQQAVTRVLPRFPVFAVHLRRGVFWYYLEENPEEPRVYPETRFPCMWRPGRGPGIFPFRVKAYAHRIALEVSHMVSDGAGALTFFRAILAEYLTLCGYSAPEGSGDIPRPETPIEPGELEDGFLRAFDPRVPDMPARPRAYHAPLPISPRGAYYVVTGLVPSSQVKQLSAHYGVSVTEFLLAVLFESYQKLVLRLEGAGRSDSPRSQGVRRAIRVLVPVDLRRFYGSRTTRNFFVFVEPEIDLRTGHYNLEELMSVAHHSMQLYAGPKNLSRYVARNVRPETRRIMRLIPRQLKDLVLTYAHQRYGEQSNTGSLSNLGKVRMPEGLREGIRHFEFAPIPSRSTKVNCAVISYGDTMAITFGKMTYARDLERIFFRRLRKLGISVRIRSNDDTVTASEPW
jgi:hypothetical protein